MATGILPATKTLDAIAAAVKAIAAIGNSRVYQGKKAFLETESLEKDIVALDAETQGIFAVWLGTRLAVNDTTGGQLTVRGMLFAYMPKETTTDANSAYELAESVTKEMVKESNFTAISVRPDGCRYSEDEDEEFKGILVFNFEAVYALPVFCS